MKCKVKTNIKAHAALAMTGVDMNMLKTALATPAKILENLKNNNDIVGLENYDELNKDKIAVARALKAIPEFKEHGLILLPGASRVASATNSFMDNLMVSDMEAVSWINSMNIKGINMKSKTPDLIRREGDKLVTDHSIQELNDMLQRVVGDKIGEKRKYVFGTKNGVRISTALKTDINRHKYDLYLNEIARVTDSSLQQDPNRPEDFNDGVRRLKSGPVISHINSRINVLQKAKKDMKGRSMRSPIVEGQIQNEIKELEIQRQAMKKKLDQDNVLIYFDKILEEVRHGLENKENLTLEDASKFNKTLDLINNAATLNDKNRVLTQNDMNDGNFVEAVQARSKDADVLAREVEQLTVSKLQDRVESFAGRDIDTDTLTTINNLENWFTRAAQNVLGLHHIDNPIFQYLNTLIDVANSKAKSIAFSINSNIESLYKKLDAEGFDITNFYQKVNGISNGRMTDVFSAEWWKSKRDILKNPNKRANMTISFDPRILFDLNKKDPDRIAHEKELKDNLGADTYKVYYKEAKTKYKEYNQALRAAKAFKDAEGLRQWELSNSPVKRIENFAKKGKGVNRGNDTYLVTVPRKIAKNGEATGFFDSNFDAIQNNPTALALHKLIKNAHIEQQIALHNYEEKFKPPTFGYVGKNYKELAKEGRIKEAGDLLYEAATKTYGRQSLLSKDTPIDDITGKAQPRLATELRSIPDEIRHRATKILEKNEEYMELKGSTFSTDKQKAAQIREEAYKEASKAVDRDKSDNFLESIALANYATISLIERKKIETEVNVIMNYLQDNLTTSTDQTDGQFKKAKRIAMDALTHYTNTAFYKIADQEAPMILNEEKRKKLKEAKTSQERIDIAEEGVTDRTIGNAMLRVSRFTVLGFSPINAMRNLAQGGFSNLFKAIEGKYFNVEDLIEGYMESLKKSNRDLLIQLDVMGDLGHQFENKNIHETDGTLRKVMNPMTIHTEVEKTNQGAIALAMLKNYMVFDTETGEEVSMLDAIRKSENYQLEDRYASKDFGGKKGVDLQSTFVIRKIRQVAMQAHGDYFSKYNLERNTGGKMFTMFFKYFPEIFMDIWGTRKENYIEGAAREGRFISLHKMLNAQINGTWDDLDEVTLANKRVAIAQAATIMGLFITFAAAAKLSCDEPECKEQHPGIIFGLNFLGSITDDVMSVANPLEPINKIANPIAAQSTVKKFGTFAMDFMTWLVPGGEEGLYKTDTEFNDEGDIKWVESGKKTLPIWGSTFMKGRRMSTELYRDSFLHNFILDSADE
jgi:hypothetical protein